MSRHLPVLMAKFPDTVMLNVDDIASLTTYSKGHIYNLASAKKLPFRVGDQLGDRILVSIVEMSDYLDSTLLSKPAEGSQPVEDVAPAKPKVGRPRGTTKAQLAIHGFQSALRTAIYKFEVGGILAELRQTAEKMALVGNDTLTCAEKFQTAKTALMHGLGAAEAQFADIEVNLTTPPALKSNADLGRPSGTL
jgi:hypothetical protein